MPRERIAAPAAGVAPPRALVAPLPPDAELARRGTRLLLVRTLVITAVLGLSVWLLAVGDVATSAAVWTQCSIIAATYLLSAIFGSLLARGVSPVRVARPQLAMDVVMTSLLVYVTGGAESPYTFLYALSIVSAGVLLHRRGAAVIAAASFVALLAVSLIGWTHLLDLPLWTRNRPWEQTTPDFLRALGINLAATIGVGGLAVLFGDQLQRTAQTLASERAAAADLVTLHRDIVRSLSSGLITTDLAGNVLTVNDAALELLRLDGDRPSPVGGPADALLPGLPALLPARPDGEVRRADLTIQVVDGEQLSLGVSVSPLRDVGEAVIGRVINFQDLTELKRLELHMRRAERLATVGQLAAGVAHEIRNPLASISGSIELLRLAPQVSDDDRSLMTIVTREIDRLNALITDLLEYANPRPPQLVECDLAVVADETLQMLRQDRAFAEVEVSRAGPASVPVLADPAALRQVLWNLLRNAADASAAGGRHVAVRVLDGDDGVGVEVRDDGAGIPPEHVARIFDPFFTTKRRGTGLGLATTHALVADHGGRIDVDSAPGRGTTMTVRLPRRPALAPAGAPPAAPAPRDATVRA